MPTAKRKPPTSLPARKAAPRAGNRPTEAEGGTGSPTANTGVGSRGRSAAAARQAAGERQRNLYVDKMKEGNKAHLSKLVPKKRAR